MSELACLDEDTVRDFVGPGTSAELLDALAMSQVRKRMLQLVLVARRVGHDAPALYVQSGLRDAYDLLVQSSPEHCNDIATYPSFGRWCAMAMRFIDNEAHINLPDGQIASHLGLLGSFAIVTASRSRDVELELRFGPDGRLSLPTLGLVADGGLEFAGTRAKYALGPNGALEVSAGGRSLVRSDARWSASNGKLRLRSMPDAGGHVELNSLDPLLRVGFGEDDFEQIGDAGACRWRTTLESARAELHRVLPAGAVEVTRSIRVLVPLVTKTRGVHRSATSADTSGMVQMSWSASKQQIAEALLHEYYHTKLNALLDLDPVFIDDDGAEAYYSPWRDDPRPLRGVLHGVFSFYIVTCFWQRACSAHWDAGVDARQARSEALRRYKQVCIGIEQVRSHAKLTAVGMVLLDEIQKRLNEYAADAEVDRPALRGIDRRLSEHQANWRTRSYVGVDRSAEQRAHLETLWTAAGGADRVIPSARFLMPMGASQSMWTTLGMDGPLEVNRVADRLPRRDLSFDMLARLSVVAPDRFHEIAAMLPSDDSDDILAELMRGHIAYISGSYEDAARCYDRCLDTVPGNLDMWRDFAFAVRHLGMRFECDVFLFRSDLAVGFAEGHVLDPEVFQRLGISPTGEVADELQTSHLHLLRWIGEAIR